MSAIMPTPNGVIMKWYNVSEPSLLLYIYLIEHDGEFD
jgi:hypothetical protein